MRYATPIRREGQCSYCCIATEPSGVFNCSVCKVVSYCSPAHQVADWPFHDTFCASVQQAEEESQEQSLKLQAKCFQCFTIEEAEHDHSWEWKDIRSWAQAQHRLITALCSTPTEPALRTALYHSQAVIRLNPSDNLNLKFSIPGIMIRLGIDIEAHGFIRRHREVSAGCQYAWAHLDLVLPEPQIEHESEDQGPIDCMPLPFQSALTLLNVRLLLCLRDLKSATILGSTLPLELVHMIQDHLVTAAVRNDSRLWRDIRAGVGVQPRIDALEKRLVDMFDVVRAQDPLFRQRLGEFAVSRESQTKLALEQGVQAWSETPGALRWVESMVRSRSPRLQTVGNSNPERNVN